MGYTVHFMHGLFILFLRKYFYGDINHLIDRAVVALLPLATGVL